MRSSPSSAVGCSLPVGAHVADGRLWTFLADLDTGISVSDEIDLPGGAADLEVGTRRRENLLVRRSRDRRRGTVRPA